MIEILHRYAKAVLYKSDTATTIAEAVTEAVKLKTNLSWSDLRGSNLSWSDLRGSNLSWSNLSWSDLRGSNLSGSDLSWSNLSWSDLRGSNLSSIDAARLMTCPASGSFTAFKKCCEDVIVKVLIPEDARRSNATGRKCRAEFVDVLEVFGAEFGLSQHDQKTRYEVGKRVTCDSWCEDRWQECAGGIHFFITREEAEDY